MNLIIVESPTKANTIQKFLGRGYKVLSSYGHVRDLPKNKIGIDIENNFKPEYVILPKAKKTIKSLKKELKGIDLIILASDEDREGEAIAWHLVHALDLNKNYQRIVFHEITEQAISEALKNPRKINMDLVDAQQARRILDRIVGYKLSPFLWKKVSRGLSAGRVQSIAVRLIAERETEIEKFIAEEYWTIIASFHSKKLSKELSSLESSFEALLIKINNETIAKLSIKNKESSEKIIKDLKDTKFSVINIDKKEVKRNPLPPFKTSTLQQEAWKKFKWPAKLTMGIAQSLYEKGFITYHRSDSLNLSSLALKGAEKFITKNYGSKYYQFRKFKTKSKSAQEAHEAIRPSYPDKIPKELKVQAKLDDNQFKLYDLIWKRFTASQMTQAIFDSTVIEIEANGHTKKYTFKSSGQILKFDGFLKVYPIQYKETEMPSLKKQEVLNLIKLSPSQHFTQPPSRYNEASLIKVLEENEIGRPSTYAPIIFTIQNRNYIEKNLQKKFQPTEIGTVVNDLLVEHFPRIVNIEWTSEMEKDLDKISRGEIKWTEKVKEFYTPFIENLEKKYDEISKKDIAETVTDKKCPECKSPLLIKLGRFGKFYACSGFPKCKHTESLEKNKLGVKCPKCKKGDLTEKRTKRRKIFYGCSTFPDCDFALWDKPTKEFCSKCESILIEKGKNIKCSNKKCDFKKE